MKLVVLLSLLAIENVAAANVQHVSASDDLRVLFDTDDELELQLAAASLWQSGDNEQVFGAAMLAPVLSCVRSLVEKRTGGLEGTRVAADILAGITLQGGEDAAALLQRCNTYRHDHAQVRVERNEQARYVSSLRDYGDRVRTLLYRFIKPTTTCHSVSGRLSAGLIAAFGGDIALEYCHANNGRHWLQTALEAEAGYGAGALLLWRFGSYRYRMNYLSGPFTYTKTRRRDWALGFGLSSAEFGEDYSHRQQGIIIAIPGRRNKRISAGIGAAYQRTWGWRAGLKFLPLGTRDEHLLAEYAALSRRDLLLEQASIAAVLRTGERAILQVEHASRGDTTSAKFRLCSPDTSVCEDLLGGRYFPLDLIESNLKRLQTAEHVLQEKSADQRTRMIATAIVATAASAPVTLKNMAGRFSRTAKILPSRWDGFDFNTHYRVNEDGTSKQPQASTSGARKRPKVSTSAASGRGLRNSRSATRQKIWRPLQEFLQKIFDSRPVSALGETASKTVESWNGLFIKLGRGRFISKTLRVGIPAIIIVSSGVTVLLTSLKLAEQELALEKVAEIKAQQEEIFKLLQNPYQEVLIHDRTLLLQSLRYLVSQP